MKLSAVIIGLGHQSLSEHIPALLRRDDIRIVGACDPSVEAQENFMQRYPELGLTIPTYSNLQELLDKTHPRIAIVAVPHDSYFDIVTELCKRHICFLKEKPLARNLAEAKDLLDIPHFGRYGLTATQRRHSTVYQDAKEALAVIGEPYLFSATYKLNIEEPHTGWRGQRQAAGGGCLIDMGYHIVDQLQWWFGEPQKLNAQISSRAVPDADYDAEDSATVSFGYPNGMHGVMLISRTAGKKIEQYAVYGPEGSIEGSRTSLSIYDKKGRLVKQIEQINNDNAIDAQLDFFIKRVRSKEGFNDTQEQQLLNVRFIERCYNDAVDRTHQPAVVS